MFRRMIKPTSERRRTLGKGTALIGAELVLLSQNTVNAVGEDGAGNAVHHHITHGHLAGEDNPPPLNKGDILLCGHTHVPVLNRHENFIYANPGSTSIPKNGSCHSYAVIEDGNMIWKDLETGSVYREEKLW